MSDRYGSVAVQPGEEKYWRRIGAILNRHPADDLVAGLVEQVVRPLTAERDAAERRAETAEQAVARVEKLYQRWISDPLPGLKAAAGGLRHALDGPAAPEEASDVDHS